MAEHVTPVRTYLVIFALLMVGTLATVLVAERDFGVFNDIVALSIAVSKALLVMLFFMHVRHSTRLTVLTALGGFLWLGILIFLTLNDYLTRGLLLAVPGK